MWCVPSLSSYWIRRKCASSDGYARTHLSSDVRCVPACGWSILKTATNHKGENQNGDTKSATNRNGDHHSGDMSKNRGSRGTVLTKRHLHVVCRIYIHYAYVSLKWVSPYSIGIKIILRGVPKSAVYERRTSGAHISRYMKGARCRPRGLKRLLTTRHAHSSASLGALTIWIHRHARNVLTFVPWLIWRKSSTTGTVAAERCACLLSKTRGCATTFGRQPRGLPSGVASAQITMLRDDVTDWIDGPGRTIWICTR
jgi:hypothetical protein